MTLIILLRGAYGTRTRDPMRDSMYSNQLN